MDLGLTGKKAIVCASSRGLGRACASSLAREGVDVYRHQRKKRRHSLNATVECASRTARRRSQSSGSRHRYPRGARGSALRLSHAPDILVNNNGGPDPGLFQQWGEEEWQAALASNLLAPTFLIKAVLPGMQERKFGRIVNITSAMVKSPHRLPRSLDRSALRPHRSVLKAFRATSRKTT